MLVVMSDRERPAAGPSWGTGGWLPPERRDAMVEPYLDQLPERTQADIMNLFTFAPSELQPSSKAFRELRLNAEFDNPSPSRL